MKRETLEVLRCPASKEPLELRSQSGKEELVTKSGEIYVINKGIPVFLRDNDVVDMNLKFQKMYDWMSHIYDPMESIYGRFLFKTNTVKGRREGLLSALEMAKGCKVIEISIGTGINFLALAKDFPPDARLYGLDISMGMLRKCRRNAKKWKLDIELINGMAEALPFKDESFDVVFHIGGINFFNDKQKAIQEMIRIAKKGSRLLISDETEKYSKEVYEKNIATSKYYSKRVEEIKVPIDLIPAEMKEIHNELILGERFYVITFRKPD
jgi:ubiquinone/menaquinone biosynthesis C-methylase UbiE